MQRMNCKVKSLRFAVIFIAVEAKRAKGRKICMKMDAKVMSKVIKNSLWYCLFLA